LIKAIQQRDLEDETNKHKRDAEVVIQTAKLAAAQQVISRRTALKAQIEKMRKDAEMRKKKLGAQLQNVRTQMAQTMGKVYKKGNTANCVSALSSEQDRNNYCIANFPDDIDASTSCKGTDDFCDYCCNNEFGEMNPDDRTNCKKTACPASLLKKDPNAAVVAPEDPTGSWVWQAGMSSSSSSSR